MENGSTQILEFGDFRLDARRRLLLARNGTSVPLSPKAFDTLAFLVEHAGRVLDKSELMQAVWPDTAVEENNLNQNISILRRIFGEARGEHRYIATVPGRGYQFVAPVRVAAPETIQDRHSEEASIAVLPFVNVSNDPDFEYFCDGLAEEIITALSNVRDLRVVARTSAFSFKGKQADVREIARRLGVRSVLEGSVRKSRSRIRITAQIINADDGCQLWSRRFEREMKMRDIFEVQDEITIAVVDALQLKLVEQNSIRAKHHTESAIAHEMYLKGRFHLFRMTPAAIQSGVAFLERAIQEDPEDALAHVGLAHAYRMFALSLEMRPNDVMPKAKISAQRAMELDPYLAEAHAVMGFNVFWSDWDWKTAASYLRRALVLNPNSADAHWMYAHLCSNTGAHHEALHQIARARELDPLSPLINAMHGQFLLHAGLLQEAEARLRESIDLDANTRVAHLFAARVYLAQGRFAEARAEAQAARALSPAHSQAIALEAYATAQMGRRPAADAALQELFRSAAERWIPPSHIATIYIGLGDYNETLAWLERGLAERDPMMVFLKVDRRWADLRDHPRFQEMLRRMHLFGSVRLE